MKKRTLISLLGGCLLAFSTQAILADDMPTGATPMSSVLKSLQAKGYNSIEKVKFEKGEYEVKAVNSQGKMEKLKINAKTGEILNMPKATQTEITALEAVEKVEAAGYKDLYKLEAGSNKYEVKALDASGKKAELDVDAVTGKVTKK